MEAAEDVSLPWRWILEHLVDMKDVGTPILRGLMTYLPNPALYSSLQKRTALRYLEEAIAGGKIDAHVIPLVAALSKESQATSSYPTTSDYNDLLLRVQIEAVITHIRGKLRDWRGFSQALDHVFPEDTMDTQYLEKRKELLILMQAQGQEKKRAEVLESYCLTALRRDLLKFIISEKARLERTFLDKLLQDVFNDKYPVSMVRKPASEIEDSQEEFHSADGRRHSIGSDDQTVVGGRNSNAESEEAVEANLKDSATTHMPREDSIIVEANLKDSATAHMPREDSIAGVRPTRKRACSQNGYVPTKRTSYGHPDLRQGDEHGKVVTTASPMKDMENLSLRSPLDKEAALEVEEDSPVVEFLEVGSDGHEEFCHKCKKGGNLLCCDGCPIAVHRKCLGFDSQSFEEEEWFCPLCARKKAVEAVKKAREKELAARQRVQQFVTNVDQRRTKERRTRSSVGPKRESEQIGGKKSVPASTLDGQQDGAKTSSEKLASKANASKRASSLLNRNEKQTSNKASDASKRASSPYNGKEGPNSNRASADPYEEFLNISTKSGTPLRASNINSTGMLDDEDDRKGKRIEEPNMQNATLIETAEKAPRLSVGGKDIDYNRHVNVSSSSKSGQIDDPADECTATQANVDAQVGDGDRHDGDLEEDSEESKPMTPPKVRKDPRLYFRGNRIIPGMRRKHLPWKKEEEDTLREGIKRFSRDNGSWGFQWTRILDFGQGKFHPSRTDVDLKDKWRNLAKLQN